METNTFQHDKSSFPMCVCGGGGGNLFKTALYSIRELSNISGYIYHYKLYIYMIGIFVET